MSFPWAYETAIPGRAIVTDTQYTLASFYRVAGHKKRYCIKDDESCRGSSGTRCVSVKIHLTERRNFSRKNLALRMTFLPRRFYIRKGGPSAILGTCISTILRLSTMCFWSGNVASRFLIVCFRLPSIPNNGVEMILRMTMMLKSVWEFYATRMSKSSNRFGFIARQIISNYRNFRLDYISIKRFCSSWFCEFDFDFNWVEWNHYGKMIQFTKKIIG